MKYINEDRTLLIYGALVVMLIGAILSAPFWAWGATTWRGQRLGIAQPAVGDVGWADINDRNHLMTEIVLVPILDGHSVVSGATPADSGGLVLSWDAGWVKFSGVSYYLPSGATTLGNNDVNWVSAVTMDGASGATARVNTGEAYPPSAASGYYTPLAIAFTEAGDITRMGDLRYMPRDHSDLHERTGIWEIDGDHLDIDWNPSYSTPAVTPTQADNVDDLTAHLYGIDQALGGKAGTGTTNHWTETQTMARVDADILRGGVSAIYGPPAAGSGGTLVASEHNTIIDHNTSTWDTYSLPAISGTSVTVFKFIEGAAGAGITIFTSDGQPFMGDGISGGSCFVLPPGSQFQACTLYGLAESGSCKYWRVEADSGWETRG